MRLYFCPLTVARERTSMYDIYAHIEAGDLTPVSEVASDEAGIADLIDQGHDFIDERTECVWLADIGGEGDLVFGMMIAALDTENMDENENPVFWALNNVPAPGTSAENRMSFVTVESAAIEIASNINAFYIVQ